MASLSANDYTIVKIKRKRDEEVPDILVVEPSLRRGVKKQRRSEVNVFERLETVDCNAWDEHDLQERFEDLTKTSSRRMKRRLSDDRSISTHSSTVRTMSQGPARQYRVVSGERRSSNLPPRVKPSRASGPSFKIYDAVIESNEGESNADPEMEKFESMLRDYLTVADPIEAVGVSSNTADSTLDDDYVYDIFYYRRRLAASELASAPAIATVKGLPPNSDDEEFSSESEMEDEADEDSNAEDFYKNDYPDEESEEESESSSDMFHESSEYDDDDDF